MALSKRTFHIYLIKFGIDDNAINRANKAKRCVYLQAQNSFVYVLQNRVCFLVGHLVKV
jgi:hypothetical protein